MTYDYYMIMIIITYPYVDGNIDPFNRNLRRTFPYDRGSPCRCCFGHFSARSHIIINML